MIVGVPQETLPGEKRVALTPAVVPMLLKAGCEVHIQAGAGDAAGYPDRQFVEKGATIVSNREAAFQTDIVLQVRAAGANPAAGQDDISRMKPGQFVIALCEPLGEPAAIHAAAAAGITLFALELLPRITRAQAMDVLSSQAMVAGYRAALLAAIHSPRLYPMMMTAAGTITPAKVFVIGAGVAGLQAIATSMRLGGIVSAYDVRPAVKEQVQSLGAKFVELPLEASAVEAKGGYAQAMDEEFYRKQRELMARAVSASDVVITTAAIPGKRSPLLVTAQAVEAMAPGSVVVDMAAERGGNCELTRAGQIITHGGVTILGPLNLPSEIPYHASQLYSKNISTFLLSLIKEGKIAIDLEDEIVRDTLVAKDGRVVNAAVAMQ